jgi:hypothetical protein
LRSAYSVSTLYAWNVYGDASLSLYYGGNVNSARGVLPAIWLSSAVPIVDKDGITIGSGTKASPYCLIAGDPLCAARLEVTTTTSSAEAGITLTGTAKASGSNQNIAVWADACNTAGQCVRKEFTGFNMATSGTAQPWTLTWLPSELPAGTYSGTIWVGLATSVDSTIIDTLSAQSAPLNFTIAPTLRTFPLTVFTHQPFALDLGPLTNYDLGALILPTTDHTVTATSTAGRLILSSTSGLAAPTTATFGNTAFVFTVIDLPQLTISNLSFE